MEPFWLSRDEVRELDKRAIEGFGVPGIVLMENAGRGCAELLMRLNPEMKTVLIICGPGNNGGDGFVIARHLQANYDVDLRILLFADPARLTGDAAINYRIADRAGVPVAVASSNAALDWIAPLTQLRRGILVDALFGTGLSRPLAAPFDEMVAIVNSSQNPVLAIDIPSGLDCDSGEPLGPTIRATHTATFVAHKKGFLNPASRAWTGEVHVVDIGAPRALLDEYRTRRNLVNSNFPV
ncbi:MAG TPA: NAD(P)H-hydrate epimerase [Gemmataceae bacterium]|jgi:NAD(P)H-hydrate epimerase